MLPLHGPERALHAWVGGGTYFVKYIFQNMTSLEGERNFAKSAVTGMCSAYRDSPYVHTHTHNSTSVLRPSKYEREPVFFTAHHFGGGVHSRTSHSSSAHTTLVVAKHKRRPTGLVPALVLAVPTPTPLLVDGSGMMGASGTRWLRWHRICSSDVGARSQLPSAPASRLGTRAG